jgi:MGT family glycosyltransferase
MKILFFHIPTLAMYHLSEPVLLELVARGHTVTHYNDAEFAPYAKTSSIAFQPYERYGGYLRGRTSTSMSLYDLGMLLLETAECTLEAVEAAVLRERPDVIVHSMFAAAPKIVARRHDLPAVCLVAGFVLQPRMVVEQTRRQGATVSAANVAASLRFRRRARAFYERHWDGPIDYDDVFMNEEALNLVFGLEAFQPGGEGAWSNHRFVGAPIEADHSSKTYELVYVSAGSVFAVDRTFFDVCIEALATIDRPVIVTLGGRLSPDAFTNLPPHIEVRGFVAQQEMLQRAALFITQGGASSLYEALAWVTPMIVVPQIPEQLLSAREVERRQLGKCIELADLTPPRLRAAVHELIDVHVWRRNLQAFKETWPKGPVAATACDHIEAFVHQPRTAPLL